MSLHHSFDNTGSQLMAHSGISLPDIPGTLKCVVFVCEITQILQTSVELSLPVWYRLSVKLLIDVWC